MGKNIEQGDNIVVCQKWGESERGWGNRPDGFSLHLSLEGLEKYVKEYWVRMPDYTPDEYSYPSGSPYKTGVSSEVRDQLEENGGDRRYYQSFDYPGSGGTDGWMRM